MEIFNITTMPKTNFITHKSLSKKPTLHFNLEYEISR